MAGPKVRKKLKKKPKTIKEITKRMKSEAMIEKFVPGLGSAFLRSFAKLIKQGHSASEAAKLLKPKGRD